MCRGGSGCNGREFIVYHDIRIDGSCLGACGIISAGMQLVRDVHIMMWCLTEIPAKPFRLSHCEYSRRTKNNHLAQWAEFTASYIRM